jgi:hypothetical protein
MVFQTGKQKAFHREVAVQRFPPEPEFEKNFMHSIFCQGFVFQLKTGKGPELLSVPEVEFFKSPLISCF